MVKNRETSLIEPPPDLFNKIMNRIHREQRFLTVKRRIVIFSVGFLGSFTVLIPVFKMLTAEFIDSGFIKFFSLLFSDFAIVTTYWQSFVFTLLGALPIMSLITFLVVFLIFLESLKHLTKDIKSILALT